MQNIETMGFTLLLSVACLSVTYASITGPSRTVATERESVQFKCNFDTYYQGHQKYWCKGYYRRSCTILVQTQGKEMKSQDGRVKIKADNKKGELTVEMEQLNQSDNGWYWCGIEINHALDLLSPTELKVNQAPKSLTKNKERLSLFLTLGIIFGILAVMILGLVILVIRKIRKHKYDDNREKESTIENSVPKSNSVLSRELEEGVTYATVTIQPNNHPQEHTAACDNVKPSNSQEAIKPTVIEAPASEPTEYSTVVFKKPRNSLCATDGKHFIIAKSVNSSWWVGKRSQFLAAQSAILSAISAGYFLLNMKNIEFTIVLVALWLPGSDGVVGPREVNGRLGGSITINCQYNIPSNRNSEKYWCKGGRRFSCTVLMDTGRSQQGRSNRLFIADNQTSGIFSITMRQLSLGDTGWYWCGIASLGNDEMTSVKLNVLEASSSELRQVNGTLGEAVTLKCQYQVPYYQHHDKYLCKGSERKLCTMIANTQVKNADISGRIIAVDNKTSGIFAVTMTELSMKDEGLYWCGITILGYDKMIPLQLNVLELLKTTTLPKESQKTVSLESKSTSSFSMILVVTVLGVLIVMFLVAAVVVIRCRNQIAAGEKELPHTEEESNSLYKDLSFRDVHGQGITYDVETSTAIFQREEFPVYIYDKHQHEQMDPV
ncbi:polymeric immunoglobulin receptor-like [Scyliorhinus canicula]|uniref:polymeric immunoglobulin receptor-like n=1 Tax=Scyliorhinus canicula TaxID=7830 RepID=UPI0018F77D89|nr:polymeric immunoglobulin receptor-like [Scyliorhinus canicula]